MRFQIFLVALIFNSISVFAGEFEISAKRRPGQPWQAALEESIAIRKARTEEGSALEASALRGLAIGGIPEWTQSFAALNDLFYAAKEVRHYTNPNPGNYLRRASWLYPADGCYSRAAHVSYVASRKGYPRPGKIYAFGNLRFRSRYARNRSTSYWSYHVAAAYHVGLTVYVVDPAVSGGGVITKAEWLSLISSNPAGVRIALCDANSYSPLSTCRGGNGNGAYLGHMPNFLRLEWSNLTRLGYAPDKLLGPEVTAPAVASGIE